jgi:hypothetical protein
MFGSAYFLASLALSASAVPVKRAANPTDLLVLRMSSAPTPVSHSPATPSEFANVLEQLETSFYGQALSKFQESDFTAAGYTSAQVPIEQFT